MKLSIVTINYNNVDGLKRTLDSILMQSFRDYEWIVIDGGSTDGSKELILANEQHIRYWWSEPDNGIYDALNKGIVHATGEYINCLNSGDAYHSADVLAKIFEQPHEGDILFGESMYHYADGAEHRTYPSEITLDYFLSHHSINHQALFIKRVWQQRFLYDTSFRISGDFNFMLRCKVEGAVFEKLDVLAIDYDATGMSQTHALEAWNEAQRAIEAVAVERYMPDSVRRFYRYYNKRRLYSRILNYALKVIEKLDK